MKRTDYYETMLDLDGLDPEIDGLADEWYKESSQKALLSALFKESRLDIVYSLLDLELVLESISEKLKIALPVKDQIFRSIPNIENEKKRIMSPRALAEAELLAWKPANQKGIKTNLAVEYPVKMDWMRMDVGYDDPEKIVDFYRKTQSYIWELMAANNIVETLYNYGVTLNRMKKMGVNEFLDYGAGIGTFIIVAHEAGFKATHMDLPSQTLEFAKWRYHFRRINLP